MAGPFLERLDMARSFGALIDTAKSVNRFTRGVAASPPTMADNSGSTSGLTNRVRVGVNTGGGSTFSVDPDRFSYIGGQKIFVSNVGTPSGGTAIDGIFMKTASTRSGDNLGDVINGERCYTSAVRIEFMTDALAVDILYLARSGAGIDEPRVLVDDQYVTAGTQVNRGGIRFRAITFADARPRKVAFEFNGGHAFCGVNVGPTYTVWKPDEQQKIAVISDSYGYGTGAAVLGEGFAFVAGAFLGLDAHSLSVPGTGYSVDGPVGTPGIRYAAKDRIGDLGTTAFAAIVFALGYNDANPANAVALEQYRADARAAWQGARAARPFTKIIVAGQWAGSRGPAQRDKDFEAALKAEFDLWADDNSRFIPICTAIEPWVKGTGYVGATNNSGNSDRYTGADGTHPPSAGHYYLGQRLAAAMIA